MLLALKMGTKEIPENLAKSNKNLSHSVKKKLVHSSILSPIKKLSLQHQLRNSGK